MIMTVIHRVPPTIIVSFRIWNPSSGEQSLLSYFKTGGLPEGISSWQTVEGTWKYYPHMVRFELKIAVPLHLTKEKRKANFWFTAQIKHWGGCRSFWTLIAGGRSDGFSVVTTATVDEFWWGKWLVAHLKSKSILPIVFQNQFQNQFPRMNLLIAVGRWRSEGVATISIFEGKEAEQ